MSEDTTNDSMESAEDTSEVSESADVTADGEVSEESVEQPEEHTDGGEEESFMDAQSLPPEFRNSREFKSMQAHFTRKNQELSKLMSDAKQAQEKAQLYDQVIEEYNRQLMAADQDGEDLNPREAQLMQQMQQMSQAVELLESAQADRDAANELDRLASAFPDSADPLVRAQMADALEANPSLDLEAAYKLVMFDAKLQAERQAGINEGVRAREAKKQATVAPSKSSNVKTTKQPKSISEAFEMVKAGLID